jgi:hypothetical protein
VTPRHFKLLVLLLPLFIARSLLPIGFMVSFDAEGARIVFCPTTIPVPVDGAQVAHSDHHAHGQHAAHHGHEHHHAGDSEQNQHGAQLNHQSCPFAFAAAAPLASFDLFVSEPLRSEAIAAPVDAAILVHPSPAHPIRGPPALSSSKSILV